MQRRIPSDSSCGSLVIPQEVAKMKTVEEAVTSFYFSEIEWPCEDAVMEDEAFWINDLFLILYILKSLC